MDLGAGFVASLGQRMATLADIVDGQNDPATFLLDRILERVKGNQLLDDDDGPSCV